MIIMIIVIITRVFLSPIKVAEKTLFRQEGSV